jgi:putative transposase
MPGSQHTSLLFGESVELHGITSSIRSVGDTDDNALGKTIIGLYKAECTRPGSPFRSGPFRLLRYVEEAISAWVAWYNPHRLTHRLGRRPPAALEVEY